MGILTWIILGLIAGALARFLMPGRDPGGFVVTMALGLGGALLGGFVASHFGFGSVSGLDLRSIGIAIAGAFILLLAYRLLFAEKT